MPNKAPKKPVALVKKPAPAKKAASAAKTEAKSTEKPMAKSAKKAEPKVKLEVVASKKGDKKSKELEIKTEEVVNTAPTEEEEEEMETAAASSGAASQAGLAMAAATAEAPTGSLKNFRHHPDLENFYRFIYENDLRYEGLEIIERMTAQGLVQKTMKGARR